MMSPRTGAELRQLRTTFGRSQEQQARLLHCHPSTISANEQRPRISRWLRRRILATDGCGAWRSWRGILRGRHDRHRDSLLRSAAARAQAAAARREAA